jgi:Coenzyme PQQ synthesis protein D (PqqD)
MLDESSIPVVREDIQYRELNDGGVVYDTSAERIHTLNLTAAYIWNCCDGSRNVMQIASELHEHANVPIDKALNDVREAITYFEKEGLLHSQ